MIKKSRLLLLSTLMFGLVLAGCNKKDESSSSTPSVEPSVVPSVEPSVTPSVTPSVEESSSVTPAATNLIDITRVMNIQSSISANGDNAANGSWWAAWEGWTINIEYDSANDVVSFVQDAAVNYSGSAGWYVQLNIPVSGWSKGSTYKLSFDFKGQSTPQDGTAANTSPIEIQLLDSTISDPDQRGEHGVVIGNLPGTTVSEYTLKEYTFTNSTLSSEGYISIPLGGRGNLAYYFRNLSLVKVD